MRSIVLTGVIGGLLAACTSGTGQEASSLAQNSRTAKSPPVASGVPRIAVLPRALSQIADLPDRGTLLAYRSQPEKHGAFTMREVQLSEAHALGAIRTGGMVIEGPDGAPIRLAYERHIEHADGNWTWIGRPAGARPGTEAILTFGEKAVFGTIPGRNNEELGIGTRNGRTYMVQADPNAASPMAAFGDADALALPVPTAAAGSKRTASATASAAPIAAAASATGSGATSTVQAVTVDVAIGYTATFASRLGGTSQALTRLNSIVDIANQGFRNSQVGGQLRLVRAVQLDFQDDTTNRSALLALSGLTCTNTGGTGQAYLPDGGVNCNTAAVPAGLQPLLAARDAVGADVAVLVRNFDSVANQSCGIAWLVGGAQSAVGLTSAAFGLAVVSDSSGSTFPSNGATCRHETFAHEVGHVLGIQHDRVTAAGSDDTNADLDPLDPEEFGRYAYAFGQKTGVGAGNYYDIMSVPSPNQTAFRVFSNPRIATCGGLACGVTGQVDAAAALGQTFPVVAAFRAPRFPIAGVGYRGDYNGDGFSDILWHNPVFDTNVIWRSANSATTQTLATVPDKAWTPVGAGDFDGDGQSDILWRHAGLGSNTIWRSGNAATAVSVGRVPDTSWVVAGIGDFNGDSRSDILWRNIVTGQNVIWRSGSASAVTAVATVDDTEFTVAAVADFDGDARDDILWRNRNDGRNVIWRSANSAATMALPTVAAQTWVIVGAGDFDGDNRADILWRNSGSGANIVWPAGNAAQPVNLLSVPAQTWVIVGIGDFNGDNRDDLLWRNSATGDNLIWRSANGSSTQAVTRVPSASWIVSG